MKKDMASETMNIMVFALTYLPFIGGAEVAVREITRRLESFTFTIITVNLDGKQKEREYRNNVSLYRIGRGYWSKYVYPQHALKLAEDLNRKKPFDMIWAIMANQAGLAASFFKKKYPQIPYLLTLQEGDSEMAIWLRTWFMRKMYKSIYRRADAIQAISTFLAKRAEQMGAVCPIHIIPNGVEVREERSIQQRFQKRHDEKVIISVSRLEKKNGLDTLIEAFALVRKRESLSLLLLLVGGGRQEKYLRRLAKSLGVDQYVHFAGNVSPDEVPYYLKRADIFVRPSRSEGLGSAFLEAMAYGLPIIGTPVGGIVDFLRDGQTGVFCRPNDPKNLAEKIQFFLHHRDFAQKVAQNGRELVFKKYQWDDIAREMKDIFISLKVQPSEQPSNFKNGNWQLELH